MGRRDGTLEQADAGIIKLRLSFGWRRWIHDDKIGFMLAGKARAEIARVEKLERDLHIFLKPILQGLSSGNDADN